MLAGIRGSASDASEFMFGVLHVGNNSDCPQYEINDFKDLVNCWLFSGSCVDLRQNEISRIRAAELTPSEARPC
jgi:hypothetical protein